MLSGNSEFFGPEVLFEEIAIDLLQARFWIVFGLPTNQRQSSHPLLHLLYRL
jgi:hypothetical protein